MIFEYYRKFRVRLYEYKMDGLVFQQEELFLQILMKLKGAVVLFFLAMITQSLAFEYLPHEKRPRWSFDYNFGGVYNFKLPLTIIQEGYPDIYIDKAIYITEPFTGPHYWDWRFTKWFDKFGISFEGIHQKIYLQNKPPEVQRFGISHGYNMCVFSFVKSFRWVNVALGAGSVLMHPESTIRGMVYPEGPGFDIHGYVLRGYVLNAGIAHQIRIWNRFFISTEAKLTFSQANAPIVNGYAKVNNMAFQFIFGGGIDFGYKKMKSEK